MLIITVLTPILLGAAISLFRFRSRNREIYVLSSVLLTSLLVFLCIFNTPKEPQILIKLTHSMFCTLKLDGMGKLFAGLVALLWPTATLYAFEYMEHEGGENSFTWSAEYTPGYHLIGTIDGEGHFLGGDSGKRFGDKFPNDSLAFPSTPSREQTNVAGYNMTIYHIADFNVDGGFKFRGSD